MTRDQRRDLLDGWLFAFGLGLGFMIWATNVACDEHTRMLRAFRPVGLRS